MTRLIRLRNRILCFWRRDRLAEELDREIAFHLELKQEEVRGIGLAEGDVLDLSRRQMGNITLAREQCRDSWSFMRVEIFWQDLRYACRAFFRTPLFTGVAVLSLALGLGGNAAMFSLINALLIRPLPYHQPDRLARITGTYPRAATPFFKAHSRTMDVAYVSTGLPFNLSGQEPAIRVHGSVVSPNFLTVLGASVALGRDFSGEAESPGRDAVVILSNALWKMRFGGDPQIAGRIITLDGRNREVIGVMPTGFSYPSADVELWIPARLDPRIPLEYWGPDFMPLIARLRGGVSLAAAQVETREIANQFRGTFPFPMARDWNATSRPVPLQEDLVGDIRGKLIILLASVGIVLLIGCANVASLLLSRATVRRKEMALRAALGAGRARIVRQLITENALLALAGAAAGLALGISVLSIFKSVLPADTPGLGQVFIDWRIAGAVTALAMIAGVAIGLAPALSASQLDLNETIKTGSPRSTSAFWVLFRKGIIGAEVALTLILAVSAGLLLKSLYLLSQTNPGFGAGRIVTAHISPDPSTCARREDCVALYDRLIARVHTMGGVESASVANALPLDGDLPTIPVEIEGHPKTVDHPAPVFAYGAVTDEYFHMLRIPLMAGRYFTRVDGTTAARVAVISASTARRFWPGESAIGKHIKPSAWVHWSTIVGVVGDVRQYRPSQALPDWVPGSLYLPYAQAATLDGHALPSMTLMVDTRSDTAQFRNALRELTEAETPNAPVGQVRRLDEIVAGASAGFRSLMRVFLSFAVSAMLLAAIGIYGLMSYWVGQRTYEIGLRVAMGASRGRIAWMIYGQGLSVAGYGIMAGVAGAWLATRLLASLLFGVAPRDIATFVSVVVLIAGLACLAVSLPAWRATRIDPIRTLRAD